MRNTKQRRAILEILQVAHKPLSAEAIQAMLPSGTLNLSTVYRNLDYFHQQGQLGKSVMEGRSFYYTADGHHHHFMICRSCQQMVPIDCHLDELTTNVAKQAQFLITHHDMTVYGYCHNCQLLLDAKRE